MDAYPQNLSIFFNLAYSQAQQGSEEAEDTGPLVLWYQFVVGLHQEIKVRLAGVERTSDQLLTSITKIHLGINAFPQSERSSVGTPCQHYHMLSVTVCCPEQPIPQLKQGFPKESVDAYV